MKINILLLLAFAAVVSACTKDQRIDDPGRTPGSYSIELLVPGQTQALPSRAIDAIKENYIGELDVLVFTESGGEERFDYSLHIPFADIKDETASGSRKIITIGLTETPPGEMTRIVVLANSTALIPSISQGDKKADVLDAIKFSAADVLWKANNGNGFDPIYMWGESDIIELDINNNIVPIQLLRVVAKVNVGLNYVNGQPQGLGNFELEKVHFFNANANGHLAPFSSNYISSDRRVSVPTVPAPNGRTLGPFSFTAEANKMLENTIYVLEAEAMTPATRATSPFVVLEGQFNGTKTFYRLDFIKDDGVNKEYIPVLRNHLYRFNVSHVDRPGDANLNDAITAEGINDFITYTLDVEDEVTTTDGTHYLSLSTDRILSMSTNAYTATMNLTTSTATWSVVEKSSWLTVTPSSGTGNGLTTTVTVDMPSSGGVQRSGYFIVKAGEDIFKKVIVHHRYCEEVPANYNGHDHPALEVLMVDQPSGYTWQHYANYPDDFFAFAEAPFPPHMQVSPPRPHSCAALNVGGHTDWRLPTAVELKSLTEYAIASDGEKIFDYKLDTYQVSSNAMRPYYYHWFRYVSASPINPEWGDNAAHSFSIDYGTVPYSSMALGIAATMIRSDDSGQTFYAYEGYAFQTNSWNANGMANSLTASQYPCNGIKGRPCVFNYRSLVQEVGGGSGSSAYFDQLKGRSSSGVRCVRGGTQNPQKTYTIPDASTGLGYDLYIMPWDQEEGGGNINGIYIYNLYNRIPGDVGGIYPELNPPHRVSCAAYNTYSYGGRNNWRVPTLMELEKMFAYLDTPQKLIAHGFPNVRSSYTPNISTLHYASSEITGDNCITLRCRSNNSPYPALMELSAGMRNITTRCVSND